MPIDLKNFAGILNTDDPNYVIPPVHHKMAYNCVFRGNGANMRMENIFGTRNITFSKPSGTNECIGGFFDNVKQRVFFFNYNSNALHGIYQLNLKTEAIDYLVLNGTNTNGDVLGFTLDKPIVNINIVYGDDVQGDILNYINCQKLPCKVNIKTALAGGYGTIQKSYLNVAKAPVTVAPYVIYQNDSGITTNNLRKKLFKFKERFVYDDLEKPVTGIQSEIPLPYNYVDTTVDADPTKNCVIFMTVQTGPSNVKKLEILGAQNISNVFSDFFLIAVLDKAALSIPDNDTYTYKFYNNQAYDYIDVEESIELFDYVPLEANAQELLNGNSLIYGGVKEGYDLIASNMSGVSTLVSERLRQKSELLYASQLGQTGFQTGNIRIIVAGNPSTGDVLNVVTLVSTTPTTITYTVGGGDTVAIIIAGLAANAVVGGFTVVSTSANDLVVSKTSVVLANFYITVASNSTIGNNSTSGTDWGSIHGWGIVEFDENGVTNGVVTQAAASVQNLNYTETTGIPNIPKTTISVYSRPALWARSFSIVRTLDLTKTKPLQWISDRTYKDESTEPDNYKYAFISIENLNTFIKNNPTSPLGYDFSPNDRIRFMKLFNGDGTTAQVYTNKEYEISGQVINPVINGVLYTGQFLKIVLPTTSGAFDFGTSAFYNYLIEIFTPAQSVANGLNVYREFGERYTIGNPGTTSAFHQGMIQNQSTNLATPATFSYTKGDYYYRNRTINTGVELDYQIGVGSIGDGRVTLGCAFQSASYTDPNITTGSSTLADLAGFDPTTDMRYLILVTSGTYVFNFKGSILFSLNDFGEQYSFFVQVYNRTSGVTVTKVYLVTPRSMPQGANQFTFDVDVPIGPNEVLFIFGYSEFGGGFFNNKTFSQSDITVTRKLNFTQGIIDPNFSDLYPSAVNSDGRPFIFDPNARQTFYGTLLRWGLAFQQGTNINQINRFYPLNFDQIDSQKGDILRLKARQRELRAFQSRGVGVMGVYTKFLQDSGNTNVVTTTDEIITKNNISYYSGIHGLGDQYTALTSSAMDDYFIDPVTGDEVRLGANGMVSLNQIFKGQYYIRSLFTPYNKTWVKPNGAPARILMAYDFFEGQVIKILQGGTNGSDTISNYAFSFNEKRNGYNCFYDLTPEWIISAQDKIVSWKNGSVYIHDDNVNYCKFYGVQYYPSITLVFNDKDAIKKTFLALAYQSNQYWVSPTNGDINTSQPNEQTGLAQISSLKSVDFDIQEGLYYAALLFDANSMADAQLALVEGDTLKGTWVEVKLTYQGSNFAWIYSPYISYAISQRNF